MSIQKNMIAAKVLFSVLGVICFMVTTSVDAAVTTQAVEGVVEVMMAGQQQWTALGNGVQLEPGAQIRTGEQGGVELQCEDGSFIQVAQFSQLEISELLFSKSEKTRVFRFNLVQGGVTVSAVELDFTRFHVTDRSLETMKAQGMPESLVMGLNSLVNKEFSQEKSYMDAAKELIGGEATVKYKYNLLSAADTGKNIFEFDADTFIANVLSSSGTITNARVDGVTVTEGDWSILLTTKGLVYLTGLVDAKEGVRFPVNLQGSWVRIGVDIDNKIITVESNAPLPQILALIGDTDTVLKVENMEDTPGFTVAYKENKEEIEGGDAAYFGIPAEEVLPVVIATYANAKFQFIKYLPYFMFREERCPECPPECCYYQAPGEIPPGPVVVPGYTPRDRPGQDTGSPTQP